MKVARIAAITKIFLDEGLGFLTESKEGMEEAAGEARPEDAELAIRLRRTLERLGPTFVKFGQLLGTRVDLFGEEMIAELSKLHSHVPPFPTSEAREVIERELGAPIDEIFAEFPDAPIASASIAQVYKARLRDPDALVAVKVQRPGLDESLLSDLEVLLYVSGLIDRLVPPYRRSMVHRVAQEYAQRARSEIDFLAEAQAIEKFSDVLVTLPEFRAPDVHRDRCTARVLVMEWLEGRKLDGVKSKVELAAQGFDPESFGRSMLRLQLSMAYEHGFVHGDTHPGNIILLPSGQIGLIDFGLHGHVPRALRDKILEMLFYQASGRIDEAVDAFVSVMQVDPGTDLDGYKRELKAVLADSKGTIRENRVTEQLISGMRIGARYRMKAQSDLFMVIRNLTIVEGIVLKYAPDLDPNAEVKEITGGIMRRKLFGPSMREELEQLLPQVLLTISRRPRTAERLLRLERSFSESKNLGEFLRKEDILRDAPPPVSNRGLVLLLVGGLGVAAGFLLHVLLG